MTENNFKHVYEYYGAENFNPTEFEVSLLDEFAFQAKRNNLYARKFKIPSIFWKGKKVLEFGCSSGETALPLVAKGTQFHFVETMLH